MELDVIKQNKEVDKIGKLLSTTDEQERSRTRLSESAKSLVSHHKRRRKDEAERQRISSLKQHRRKGEIYENAERILEKIKEIPKE